MHLGFYDWNGCMYVAPTPVAMRGWGGVAGLGQSMSLSEDPVARHGWGGLWGLGVTASRPPSAASIAAMAAEGASRTAQILAPLHNLSSMANEFMGLRGLGQIPEQDLEYIARNLYRYEGLYGLGQQITPPMTGSQIASTVGSTVASAGAITGTLASSAIGLLPASFAMAGPIGAAVGAAVAIGVQLAKVFAGCGQTCVAATSIANQVEPLLQQNVQNYISTPVRYASLQAAALNNFDTTWNSLVQACSNPSLASAGQACIQDRQSGSCKYKTSPGNGCSPSESNCWTGTPPNCTFNPGGPAGSGNACWDWFIGYRNPIANDPCVQPDPTATDVASGATAAQVNSATSAVGSAPMNLMPLLLIGGGVVLLMMMGGGKG